MHKHTWKCCPNYLPTFLQFYHIYGQLSPNDRETIWDMHCLMILLLCKHHKVYLTGMAPTSLNGIVLWDHHGICHLSLTETSLYGEWLYICISEQYVVCFFISLNFIEINLHVLLAQHSLRFIQADMCIWLIPFWANSLPNLNSSLICLSGFLSMDT